MVMMMVMMIMTVIADMVMMVMMMILMMMMMMIWNYYDDFVAVPMIMTNIATILMVGDRDLTALAGLSVSQKPVKNCEQFNRS